MVHGMVQGVGYRYFVRAAARKLDLAGWVVTGYFISYAVSMTFMGKVSDISLCDRVEKKLRDLQKSGKGMSSPEGMILAYMSPDDLHTLPEMKELVDLIWRHAPARVCKGNAQPVVGILFHGRAQGPALWHRLESVPREVPKHLF